MNKKIIFTYPVIVFAVFFGIYKYVQSPNSEITDLRQQHTAFLEQNVPENNKDLSRTERIRNGLPPNPYYELMNYLTMNPALGYPEPYKVRKIGEQLRKHRKNSNQKAPGEKDESPWVSRGPNNVGGRTRVVLFDPNDTDFNRVFAASVSGGLWVNNNITNVNSNWSLVPGLPSNLNVSSITVDPRDSMTWYIGTGEQYTGGDVIGTGVYKTTDGGDTWTKILDVKDFATDGSGQNSEVIGGLYFINDIIAWDNGTSTEVFIGVTTHIYADARNPLNFLGFYDRGLYRTVDGGSNWEQLIEGDSFNDFEIDAAGNLWVATTDSPGEGEDARGGKIYKRDLGENTTFNLVNTIPDVLRTEIEASATNPNKFYIAAESLDEEADLYITTDGFATITPLNEPNDADNDISATDFSRGLAFYALLLESDPANDEIVYAGSIDLFRSTDSGQTWEQISKWSDNPGLNNLPVSEVHADHHVMAFRPGNSNQAAFGHDGGVSFASDLSAASSSKVFITPETNYITTQFYTMAVAPSSFATGDYFLGGTQDNGSLLIQNGDPNSMGVLDGDGAYSFFDQVDTKYFIANITYNNGIFAYNYDKQDYTLVYYNFDGPDSSEGTFINPQALDSNLDKLFSNGPNGEFFRYDDIDDLAPIGDEFNENDVPAKRTTFSNPLLNTQPESLASITAMTVSPYTVTSTTLLVGLINGKLIRVKKADGDPSQAVWEDITGNAFLGSISDVEYGKTEDEIYVTFYNFGVRNIWYTRNGTSSNPTWNSKDGNFPDLPVLTIMPNPEDENEVIIGTDLGVWVTNNFQDTPPVWEHAYNGMSDVKVTDLDLKKGTRKVFAATYGRGIFSGEFKASVTGGNPPPGTEEEKMVIYQSDTDPDGIFNIVTGKTLEQATIYVFDIKGQLISTQTNRFDPNIPVPVDLSGKASGVYLIKVEGVGTDFVGKVARK